MEVLIEDSIDVLKIDRSDWQLVKFGDVAIQQKQAVDRESTDLTRYVKGEHMYSEDLILQVWGELEDEYLGPAFIRKFEEGDILYGSRRTYLRKVVIAPFDGITSNTTFVIKANRDEIESALLPYLMLSENFAQHSIKNSKGSVNPYVNWKDIAKYDFLLPPKRNQFEILSIIKSIEEVKNNYNKLSQSVKIYEKTLLKELEKDVDGSCSKVGDYIDITNGFAFKGNDFGEEETDTILMTPGNFKVGGGFNDKKLKYFKGELESKRFVFDVGDLVITMTDLSKEGHTLGMPAFIPNISGKCILHNQRLGRVHFKSQDILPEFLYHVFRTSSYRNHIVRAATRTTVSHTYPERIASYKFKLISIDEQNKWIDRFRESADLNSIEVKRDGLFDSLSKSIINQVF